MKRVGLAGELMEILLGQPRHLEARARQLACVEWKLETGDVELHRHIQGGISSAGWGEAKSDVEASRSRQF